METEIIKTDNDNILIERKTIDTFIKINEITEEKNNILKIIGENNIKLNKLLSSTSEDFADLINQEIVNLGSDNKALTIRLEYINNILNQYGG